MGSPQFLQRAQQLQDTRWAQQNEPRDQAVKAHGLAIAGLQQKLQTIDQTKDPQGYASVVDQIQQNVHGMRELLHPDAKLGIGDWLKTHTTDRLHITNHDQRVKDLATKNAQGTAQDASTAQAYGQGAPDTAALQQTQYGSITGHPMNSEDTEAFARHVAGIPIAAHPNYKNFRGPNGETQTLDANQAIPAGFTLETAQNSKGYKPLMASGVPVGITGPDGKVYTAKDIDKPDTPPEVKAEWGALDAGQKAKAEQFEARRKEQYAHMEKMQRTAIAAANQRAMYAFQNQLSLGQFKPAEAIMAKQELQVYQDKGMMEKMTSLLPDALAGNQQAQLAILMNHVAMTTHQPGGTQRVTRAMVEEAQQSAPWIQNIEKKYSSDGYLEGVTLSPEQMQNMVDLAPNTLAADTTVLEGMKKDFGAGGEGGTVTPAPAQLKATQSVNSKRSGQKGKSKPIIQHSASTGQYRYSLDGGSTWQPGKPPAQ